jgi:uncharacterized delta-60 repeat protein
MTCLLALAAPVAAIDGELDTENFYPPNGRIGFVGGGIVADGGLVDPDGMAIALMRMNGAEVRWRQVPDDLQAATICDFTPPLATEARYRDARFDAEGRLVLVGTATFPALGDLIFVVRYLYPDCTLDPGFSGDGYFTFDLAEDLAGLKVRTQTVFVLGLPVERLVVAGDRELDGTGGDFRDTIVLRLTGAGALDATFDGDGWTNLDFDGESQLLADFVVDRQRRIVLGANLDPLSADSSWLIGRLLPDGGLDPTLDSDGWWHIGPTSGAAEQVGAMAAAANGDVLFAGTVDNGPERRIFVSRLNLSLHGTSFASAGDLSAVTCAALQGDRKLVVAGWSNGFDGDFDVFALRVRVPAVGSPSVDPDFGSGAEPDPLTYFSFEAAPGGTDAAWGIALAAGRPVLFGEANFGDPQGMFVARLDNAYLFADGFESGSTNSW